MRGTGLYRKRNFLDTFFDDDLFVPDLTSWTWHGQWVDIDKYDIVPKENYVKTLVEEKDKEIGIVESRLKALKEERDNLLKKKT